jgi:hypothetical protein
MHRANHPLEQQWIRINPHDFIGQHLNRLYAGVANSEIGQRQRQDEASQRPRDGNIEHRLAVRHSRLLYDHGAHGPERADGEGDKKGQACRNAVTPGLQIMSQLVRTQHGHHTSGVFQTMKQAADKISRHGKTHKSRGKRAQARQ